MRRRRRGRAGVPRLTWLLAVLAVVCGPAGTAWAHAQLVGAEPPAGAVVAEAPEAVVLRFSEPVAPLVIRWFDPDGVAREVAAQARDGTLRVPVPEGAARGTHVLSWRVVSADGHPVGGAHVFSIGAPSAAVAPDAGAGTAALAAVARGLLSLALTLGVGGAVFARLVDRERRAPGWTRRLAVVAGLAAPVAAVLALGMHGRDLLGAEASVLAPATWRAAMASPFAATAGLGGLAGLVAGAAMGRRAGKALAVAAWGLAALSFAVSGHAARAGPGWLTAPAMALHGAALIFWLGALPGIVGAAVGGAGLGPLLRRFSGLAAPLVAVLVVTGATLAAIQVVRPSAMLDTAYGRLLSVKLVAVGAMLGLAVFNRAVLTPRIGEARCRARLARSAGAELLLGVAILALATGFRLTPPPRALAAAPAEAYVHLHGVEVMADVTLRPGRAGANEVEIVLADAAFAPLRPLEVGVAFSLPGRGLEPITATATLEGEVWRAGPLHLPAAAAWSVAVDVLIDDFSKEVLSGEVRVTR